jgi:hypothetical protein
MPSAAVQGICKALGQTLDDYKSNSELGCCCCCCCCCCCRLLEHPEAGDRAAIEQRLSGICSFACFRAFHPEGRNSGPDWYGQEAEHPEGLAYAIG